MEEVTSITEPKKATVKKPAPKKPAAKKPAPKKAVARKASEPKEQMELFTLRIQPSLLADLEKIAKKRETTPAAIIRTAMASYINSNKKLGRM